MSIWDIPEYDLVLERMWAGGSSAAQIAVRLGSRFNRNMVIGRAHRLKLAKRPTPIIRHGERSANAVSRSAANQKRRAAMLQEESCDVQKRRAETATERKVRLLSALEAVETLRLSEQKRRQRMLARAEQSDRHQCAYPTGDPKHSDFHFCGLLVKPGSSYCLEHHAVCWKAYTLPANVPNPIPAPKVADGDVRFGGK